MSINSLNLPEIDQEQALSLTRFFVKNGKNIFLFGRRGTGKTEIAIQAIKELNYNVSYINLSVIERPDLSGYPDLNSKSNIVEYKSPFFLPPLDGKPNTVLLFDEVDKAPPEVTAPLLEILQFKKINGKNINAVSCILTGNLSSEGAYSNEISKPLLDRGGKFLLNFNVNKWLDWARLNNVHDLILGFLSSNPEYACGKIDDLSYASASARAWTLASEAIKDAKKINIVDIETISIIISGFVGYEIGLKFKIWYEYFRSFENPINFLLENGRLNTDFDFEKLNQTEKVIFCISLCHLVKQKFLNQKNKNFQYIETLSYFFKNCKVEKEMQVISLNNAFPVEIITKYKLYTCNNFFDLYSSLNQNVIFKK